MAFYTVDKETGDITLSAGGTLYADLPVGAWIKWDDQTNLPDGFLKAGDTVLQSKYPEIYAQYGSTVPYKADKSELSAYENITISASSSSPTVMSYDGYLTVTAIGGNKSIYINGVRAANAAPSGSTDASTTVAVKKGDQIYFSSWYNGCCLGAFYKKSLIVKAKQTPVPADFMSAVDDSISQSSVAKLLPYSFNKSQNIASFNRQFVYEGHDLTWTATHTGRLTLRLLKNGDGYSLYFYNTTTNTLMDSYDNFFGTDSQSAGCTQASITLQGWVRKGDSIRLESNLPSSTALDHTFFCQTGLLAYNNNYD